jgi:hypothetical protein
MFGQLQERVSVGCLTMCASDRSDGRDGLRESLYPDIRAGWLLFDVDSMNGFEIGQQLEEALLDVAQCFQPYSQDRPRRYPGSPNDYLSVHFLPDQKRETAEGSQS